MLLKTDTLIGKTFTIGRQDCYTLVRDFYTQNFDLSMRNYARPDVFWEYDMPLYTDNFHKEGFRSVDVSARELEPGDLLLMAVKSKVANHAAVVMPDGMILHHLYGQLSRCEPYRDAWRNMTVAVLRHPDVRYQAPVETAATLLEVLPAHVRQRYLDTIANTGPREGGLHSS
jgi:cell wall-associated NlpC family hydrolase